MAPEKIPLMIVSITVSANVCVPLWFTSGLSSMRLIGQCDPPYGLPSRAPSEQDDMGQFDDDTPSHRGLPGGPFLQHPPVLPQCVFQEPELSTTYCTTNSSCTCLIMCES